MKKFSANSIVRVRRIRNLNSHGFPGCGQKETPGVEYETHFTSIEKKSVCQGNKV